MKKASTLYLFITSALAGIATPVLAEAAAPSDQPAPNTAPAQQDPSGAAGQTSAARDSGDIVVVARRREESLQRIPVAVTAVTGAALQEQGITSTLDLPRVAAGLNATPSGGVSRNLPLYSIRGQQQGEFLATTDPSVGIYWGDILVQRAYGTDLEMFDLRQVEVLKGPQGTLFGRNTTGGNIIFRPNTPTDRLEGGAFIQTGSYQATTAEAYVNLPLADGIALRVAGTYRYRDGFARNVYDGPYRYGEISLIDGMPNRPALAVSSGLPVDLDGERAAGLRASLNIESGKFHNLTVGTFTTRNTSGSDYRLTSLKPGSPAAALFGLVAPNELATIQALPSTQVRQDWQSYTRMPWSWTAANTSTYDLTDHVALRNIAGYHSYSVVNFEDIDGSPVPLIAYGAKQGGWEFSDEFQVIGTNPGFNWLLGAYYYRERGYNVSVTPDLLGFFNTETPTSVYETARNSSFSVFGSGTLKLGFIGDNLSLTLGGRYTWDSRAAVFGTREHISTPSEECELAANSGTYTAYNARYDPIACTMSMNTNFANFTYTTSLDWQVTPSTLLYIAHRKGYRSGGFNTRATDPTGYGPFRPEQVRDLEVGVKGNWHLGEDTRLRMNLAGYYQWYSDIQRLLTFSPCANCVQQTVIQNAASAHIYGGEAEINLSFGQWLSLYSNVALVRPVYEKFVFQGTDYASTATFGGALRNQFAVGGTLTVPTSENFARPNLQVNWYKQSSYFNQDSITSPVQARVPGYSVTNVRFELANIARSNVTVGVGVNNVFDKRYLTTIFSLYDQLGFTSGQYAPPRTWNADLRFSF